MLRDGTEAAFMTNAQQGISSDSDTYQCFDDMTHAIDALLYDRASDKGERPGM